MQLRASLLGALVLTVAVAACGGDGGGDKPAASTSSSSSTTSSPAASTTPTTALGQPDGTYDGVTWKVEEKPDADGTCQTVELGGRPTDFAGNGTKSCVPVPAKDSQGADPVELASGTNQTAGGAPVFISGFSAPEIESLQVSTADGPATVTRWPSGGFIAWSSQPAESITFTIDEQPHSCAVAWVERDGVSKPTQRCVGPTG
jgi:hypothetical protein